MFVSIVAYTVVERTRPNVGSPPSHKGTDYGPFVSATSELSVYTVCDCFIA